MMLAASRPIYLIPEPVVLPVGHQWSRAYPCTLSRTDRGSVPSPVFSRVSPTPGSAIFSSSDRAPQVHEGSGGGAGVRGSGTQTGPARSIFGCRRRDPIVSTHLTMFGWVSRCCLDPTVPRGPGREARCNESDLIAGEDDEPTEGSAHGGGPLPRNVCRAAKERQCPDGGHWMVCWSQREEGGARGGDGGKGHSGS